MRTILFILVAAFVFFGCVGCSEPPAPCNGTCTMEQTGPAGWQSVAQNIWDYYAAATGASGPSSPPSDAIRFVTLGDCPGEPRLFKADDGECVAGLTLLWTTPSGPTIEYIYVMAPLYLKPGILHHELLHAWLGLSRMQDDGDPEHSRPEWNILLPDAVRDVQN